jgi:hypothetical protein
MARSMVRAHPNSVGPSGNLNVRSGSNRERLSASICRPLQPKKRTFPPPLGSSESCQNQSWPGEAAIGDDRMRRYAPRPLRLLRGPRKERAMLWQ